MKIKAKDKVLITAGKDKGKTGIVEKVFPKNGKVLIPGLNLYKKHLKPRGEGKPGGRVDVSRPLPVGNIALICPKCNQPTRVGYQIIEGEKKIRICKKCKSPIEEK